MISIIVSNIKQSLDTLNVFCELAGLVKAVPLQDRLTPFSCELSLEDCKKGTEITPSQKNKLVGFFEQTKAPVELDFGENKNRLYTGEVQFVAWYNCDSVRVVNQGDEVGCCDKQAYLQELFASTILDTQIVSNLFANFDFGQIKFMDYDYRGFEINDRLKHHPFYAFKIIIPFTYVINDSCATGLDITVEKLDC